MYYTPKVSLSYSLYNAIKYLQRAQSVERRTLDVDVRGSKPVVGAGGGARH